MIRCKKCLTPTTRPRVEFDSEGICNACRYDEKKKTGIDWVSRWRELEAICDQYRRTDGSFDCVAPLSGGKDGNYVAYKLKHELGMHPLCVTFAPPMPTDIGRRNLEAFIQSGYDHLMINPNPEVYRKFNKEAFISRGMPKQAFVTGMSAAVMRLMLKFDIQLVIYGENGEVIYGGKSETESLSRMNQDFLKNIYYEGQDPSEYGYWWQLATEEQLQKVHMTWWSYFEDWEPLLHYQVAKEKCGFQALDKPSTGTFTNYAQLDDKLQDLHTYLQFVKFGFGRCTSDACIEIRRGRLTREEGVQLVNDIDGSFPHQYLDDYLAYFQMTADEFWRVVDGFANQEVLKFNAQYGRRWVLKEPCT